MGKISPRLDASYWWWIVKVLFVASNPIDASSLSLDREITELQRRFLSVSDEPVSFAFLPDLKLEDFPARVSEIRPDILHFAAHGDADSLSMSDTGGNAVSLTADMLEDFLPQTQPPRLIYFNACNSRELARSLVESGSVGMAIGKIGRAHV